ncbi:MAG: DUF2141 domain-containing protein [Spirochaetales bacterium]|jgi:uncharacterized protein (DUF2141 family)|nr:DUF2141 domain-containing protein [Spirochaetales bacterium]
MSKTKLVFLFFALGFMNVFANDINLTLRITGVSVGAGKVYVVIYSNENDYKNNTWFLAFPLESVNTSLSHNFTLPDGEYVFALFQDLNDNVQVDTNILGLPKEPVGMSNYSGRGLPGNFDRLKVPVHNNGTSVTINLR